MELVDLSAIKFERNEEHHCKEQLKSARWANTFVCPACGHTKAYELRTRPVMECANKKCKRQTSVTAGTQFHNTRTLEKVWLLLQQSLHDPAHLAKSTIKNIMNVSAETARRVHEILSQSFTRLKAELKKPEPERTIPNLRSIEANNSISSDALSKSTDLLSDNKRSLSLIEEALLIIARCALDLEQLSS